VIAEEFTAWWEASHVLMRSISADMFEGKAYTGECIYKELEAVHEVLRRRLIVMGSAEEIKQRISKGALAFKQQQAGSTRGGSGSKTAKGSGVGGKRLPRCGECSTCLRPTLKKGCERNKRQAEGQAAAEPAAKRQALAESVAEPAAEPEPEQPTQDAGGWRFGRANRGTMLKELVQAEKTAPGGKSSGSQAVHRKWKALGFADVELNEKGNATKYLVKWLNYAASWMDASIYDNDPDLDDWKEAVVAAKKAGLI
jgi:hypothetical protein